MEDLDLPAGAVLMPAPTLAERQEITELLRAPRAYTHPVTFNARNLSVGTAVFLRHGDRLFAFTAAHNIGDDTTIHFRMLSAGDRTLFNILSAYKHPRYDPDPFSGTSKFDLAILELEPNARVPAGDVGQLHTGGFARMSPGEPKPTSSEFVWVVGYPCELAEPGEARTTLYQTTFATQILGCAADELVLHYPTHAYQMRHGATAYETGKTTDTPQGYSGGGVWVTSNPPGVMFNPQRHVKLVGIQTHWSSRSQRLRCVPSGVVAEAFRDFTANK